MKLSDDELLVIHTRAKTDSYASEEEMIRDAEKIRSELIEIIQITKDSNKKETAKKLLAKIETVLYLLSKLQR